MSDNTKIEWADATANYINGCTVVSPGCTNCYAMRLAGTRMKHHPSRAGLTIDTKAGPVWNGEVRRNERVLQEVLGWRKPRRIFWNAHGDMFHDSVPDEWIDAAFAVMALTPQHIHMVLTKRPARMREYISSYKPWVDPRSKVLSSHRLSWERQWAEGPRQPCYITRGGVAPDARPKGSPLLHYRETKWPLPNVWLGVSVEDQARADERIPDLLATPAAVRFLSCEPLLGPVDLTRIMQAGAEECFHTKGKKPWARSDGSLWYETRSSLNCLTGHYWGEDLIDGRWEGWCGEEDTVSPGFGKPGYFRPIDWVIAGGESGPAARPMHPDWARSLRDQCAAADVPFHFKQWGEWAPHPTGEPVTIRQYNNQIGYIDVDTGARKPHPNRTTDHTMRRVGKRKAGRLLDGVAHDGVPA